MGWLLIIGLGAAAVFAGPPGLLVLLALTVAAGIYASWPRPLVYGLAPKALRLRRVIDGDTFEVEAPPGSPAHLGGVVSVRLRGCDAFELSAPGGEAAREHLEKFLRRGRIFCEGVGREKYGRALATVTVRGKDAAQYLIDEGAAVPYEGGSRA